ncbi:MULTISPECIES: N-terminal phage integrase SAM-like domain-containing protein [Streptomyces]|uniref:N-terminal phage integrase SAM-like domain-containing protein n=1 Tax=Streptomyces TaxID=1883 RepID=UPI000262F753|nr:MULTISPECIES: N-terminal phage integrase SAM-like domain-containing protein [Streptomyces]MYS91447.1 hypothetical protein [Streptomyces sp. SID5464]
MGERWTAAATWSPGGGEGGFDGAHGVEDRDAERGPGGADLVGVAVEELPVVGGLPARGFSEFLVGLVEGVEVVAHAAGGGHVVVPVDARASWRSVQRRAKWWEEWWPANEPSRPTTRNRKLSAWTVHIQPKWGKRKLNSLTYLELQTWVAKELKGYATQTKVLELLKMMLRHAVRDQRIPFNPAADVTKTASPPVRHPDDLTPPTEEQYTEIRKHIPVWWQPVTDFLENTGLRWGETAGTRRIFLDLEADTVKVWSSTTAARCAARASRRRRPASAPSRSR